MGKITVNDTHRTAKKHNFEEFFKDQEYVFNSRKKNERSTWGKMNTFKPNVEGLRKRSGAHDNFNKLLLFSRSVFKCKL